MENICLQNWKFCMDENVKKNIVNAAAAEYVPLADPWAPGFDDSGWNAVIVPHDWSVSFPFDRKWSSGTGYLAGGTGWYRTVFNVPENWNGEKAFVCFDGVYKNSKVWCNGYYLGNRPFGYINFSYDISHCLRPGNNILAVMVSHEDIADSRWFTGSGIYRKAFIRFNDRLFIDGRGVIVRTNCLNGEAEINVTGEISGKLNEGKPVKVFARLEGKNGKIYKAETTCGKGVNSFALNIKVPDPELWSPETPYLYKLNLDLQEEGTASAVNALVLNTGIRTIRFDPDKGFFLNDNPYKIKGVCVHHDAGCLGAAVWPEVWRRKLEKLKDAGCNAIRTSHNPHMEELYDLCDEMGFLVMDEAFDEWEGCKNKWTRGHNVYPPVHQGYAEDFPQWHERDIADMVIRNRNRPCVIMWSIGNEVDYPNDPYVHPLFTEMTGNNDANKPKAEMMYNNDKPNMERLATISRNLVGIVKKHDPDRPVLFAAAFPELSSKLGIFESLDMVGYNYKEHLYEEDHRRFPRLPIIGSENGHGISQWKAVTDNEYISGQFLWTGIDYLGEAGGWPVRGSGAGILDIAGNEKTAYFRRKALWTCKPFLYLVSRHKPEGTGGGETPPWRLFRTWDYIPGQPVEVVCYTNLNNAELFCNGKSCGIGELQKNHGYISWTIPFERGILTVKSTDTNENACDTLESCLSPVRLNLKEWKSAASKKEIPEGKYRIVQIEAEMLDEAGRLCASSRHTVSVSLNGEGKILGLENGDLSDCTEYASRSRRLYGGKLVIYALLPCNPEKPVSVTASVEGFSPEVISV